MAAVEVLDPQPGEHVLDLCAGPGIKTGQIAARMGDRGETISVELDPRGPRRSPTRRSGSGCAASPWSRPTRPRRRLAPGFDRVLVDAPCSDLGALASRPDARWRKSPRAIERLVEVQRRLLRRAVAALRPGGVLVYATCTISRRENEDRVAALLAAAGAGSPAARVEDLERPGAGARLAARPALPAAAPRPRPHHRILHLPPETG